MSDDEKQAIADHMFQVIDRVGTTEQAIHVMFNSDLQAFIPLNGVEKLCNPDFPIPISFFYGEDDWVFTVEENAG